MSKRSGMALLFEVMAIVAVVVIMSTSGVIGATIVTLEAIPSLPGNVYFPWEPVQIELRLRSLAWGDFPHEDPPVLTYRVLDVWGGEIHKGSRVVESIGNHTGRVELEIAIPEDARGWYRIDFELADGDKETLLRQPAVASRESYVTVAVIDPPRPGDPDGSFFGIHEHQLSDAIAAVMVRAGMRWLRTDVLWENIQFQREGSLDWRRLDDIVSVASRHDIALLPIVGGTAPFAAERLEGVRDGFSNRYPAREDDWRRFVRALAERYRGSIHAWEVRNEANTGFWLGTAEHYSDNLRQAYEEIHAADPASIVSIAGTSGVDMNWFRQVAEFGGAPYMDVVSVHPYMQPTPPERGLVRALMNVIDWARHLRPPAIGAVGDRPLWITEFGYQTRGGDRSVFEITQAEFLVRAMVLAWAAGVERLFWYEFADGSDPYDPEQNFGLVYQNLTPKPAYVAYAVMARLLEGSDVPRKLAFDDQRLHAYEFCRQGECVVVAWALEAVQVEWPVEDAATLFDLMGQGAPLTRIDASGNAAIDLGSSPVYIVGLDLQAMETQGFVVVSEDPLAVKSGSRLEDGVNIVLNGSFEQRDSLSALPSGWTEHISGGADFHWEYQQGARDVPDGDTYLRLRNGTPSQSGVYGRIQQNVPVKPWTAYTLHAKVRTHNNAKAWIGGGPGWSVRFLLPYDTDGEWREVSGVFSTESEDVWSLIVLLEDLDEIVDLDHVRIIEVR